MNNKTERMHIRVTEQEKEFIKSKTTELGFHSMTAFIKQSVKNDRHLMIDRSDFIKLLSELRSINRNIRSLIKDFSDESLQFTDTSKIEESMINIERLIKDREKELDQLEKDFNGMPTRQLLEVLRKYNL